MKRHLATSLAVLLLLALVLAGCEASWMKVQSGQNQGQDESVAKALDIMEESNLTPKGTLPIVREKVKLTLFQALGEGVDPDANLATRELEKRTNIDLEITTAAWQVANDKIQMMLNADDYPEVMTVSFGTTQLLNYATKGRIIIPLKKLIEENGVEINHIFEKFPEYEQAITAPDGEIYGLSAINECFHCSFAVKMYINTKWIKKLGFSFEFPETTEDFYQVLKAFKEKDPNGNGKQDEIPLSGAIKWWNGEPEQFIMNAFIYYDRNTNLMLQDGRVQFVADKPEWKEGLKYLNRLYSEKLLDPTAFTQNLEQIQAIAQNKEAVLLGAFASGFNSAYLAMDDSKPEVMDVYNQYWAMPPLKGPAGNRVAVTGARFSGAANFVIMDTCKNPRVAIRLADYLYTEEGTHLTYDGPEGVLWEKAGPDDKDIMGRPAKWRAVSYPEGKVPVNVSWGQGHVGFRGSELDGFRGHWLISQDITTAAGFEKRLFVETEKNYLPYKPKEVLPALWFDEVEIADIGQLQTQLNDYIYQSMLKFITGEWNIESGWDGYINELKTMGADKYLILQQEAYQRYISRTGK